MKSILIFSNGEKIGDGIIKLPLLNEIKKRLVDFKIFWMTNENATVYNCVLKKISSNYIDEIYEKAINLFKKSSKKFDSLFSATAIKGHYWDYKTKPINHNPFEKKHIVKSKLKPLFSQNGGIFIRYKKDMIKDGRFIGNKPLIFSMNEIDGWDLDHPWQLEVARTLVKFKYVK